MAARSKEPPDPFEGHDVSFAGVRLANMLDFASATAEQKIDWLGEMLELYNEIHGIAQRADRSRGGQVTRVDGMTD